MGKVSVSIYGKPDDVTELLTKLQRQPQVADFGEPLDYEDVRQALRRFVVRVSGDEDATPAELQAMAKVAPL